jgi:hypothetical protein
MEWKEILSKVSTKGDVATVLLAGTVGFIGDVALSLTGVISPGTCAALAAAAGVGAKQGIQAGIEGRRSGRLAKAAAHDAVEKAQKAAGVLDREGLDVEARRLNRELLLFNEGLSDETQLAATTKQCLDALRNQPPRETK